MPENLRTLKKDFDYLIDEVISDCCTFVYVNPDKKEAEAMDVINEAIALRDEMFERLNKIREKPAKPHIKALKEEFLTRIDALFEKISELAK
ncbi:MAG TPA: hypothetical protein PKY83_03060 [Bacteroidales bacterium]|jgi:hypothetical protein|nr:hypothetical protein [Bacteroidales bacterium]MCZ2417723.1 hypothetical protein [Burkholderiales bacterium]OQC58194.1 MAG: hypothetical protein BWX52_00374 [Bacteroidetes bacterium ADurb.Bin013]MBP8999687.1 hypothetical protein [Bacteroidales bacterium]MBV6455963.1 hypothetical protein [Bacteroidales bacterium]